jgi:glutamate--cysteine ligase
MDAFLLYCLLSDSPETPEEEYAEWQENQKRIVYSGRDPELKLLRDGTEVIFKDWAQEILDSSLACAKLLDQSYGGDDFASSVQNQFAKLSNPELTPSARVLADLNAQHKTFFEHTLTLAESHRRYFSERLLTAEKQVEFEAQAMQSLQDQQQLEGSPHIAFDEYLAKYYEQYRSCSCSQNS